MFVYRGRKWNHLLWLHLSLLFLNTNVGLWLQMRKNNWFGWTVNVLTKKNSDQKPKPSKALSLCGRIVKWRNASQKRWMMQLVKFPDKTRGGDLPAKIPLPSNTLIPLPNRKSVECFPPFSFPVCCLSCSFNGDAPCPGRNNSYWERPEPNMTGRPSPFEPLWTTTAERTLRQKATGLQQGGLKCLAEIRPGRDVCVATEHFSIQCIQCGRECFLFIGGWAETLQETPLSVKQFAESDIQQKPSELPMPLIYTSCSHVAFVPPQLFLSECWAFQVESAILMRHLRTKCPNVLHVVKVKHTQLRKTRYNHISHSAKQ